METPPENGFPYSPSRQELRKRIWQLTVPVILANVTIPLVGLVDTAVMGHFDSPHYIGAVALGSFLFSMVTVAFGFLRMATTGLVAQAMGAEDRDLMLIQLLRGLFLALAMGVLVLVLAQPLIFVAQKTLSGSPAVLEGMARYMTIIAFAGPAVCFNMVVLGLLFGMQRVRACMVQMVVINSVNIAGNLILVFGFGMKIEGVALATVIAQYCGTGVSFILMAMGMGMPWQWQWPSLNAVVSFAALRQYLGLGRDLTIRTLGILLGEIIVLNMSAAIDDVMLAASQLCFVLFAVIAYGLDGFAHAAESLVGAAIGRRDLPGLKAAIRESTIMAFVMALLASLLVALLGNTFFAFMTSLEDVRAVANDLLIWMVLLPTISVLAFQLDGVFIGATQAVVMRNAMLVSVILFLPLVLIGEKLAGINGIWFAFLILLGLRGLTLWLKIGHVYRLAKPVST
ncbi:MAG: MATE family efflux transporter [Candidatus Puniceispirillales bacterium]